jgi:Glyoxalase-like domain
MGTIREIVFDCEHPAVLARFWAALLDGYAVRPYDQAEIDRLAGLGLTPETDPTVMVDGPGPLLCFQRVAGRKYENNRVHLDIAVADRTVEVARMRKLGGQVEREASGYTVMRDPEGNQFCVVEHQAPGTVNALPFSG